MAMTSFRRPIDKDRERLTCHAAAGELGPNLDRVEALSHGSGDSQHRAIAWSRCARSACTEKSPKPGGAPFALS